MKRTAILLGFLLVGVLAPTTQAEENKTIPQLIEQFQADYDAWVQKIQSAPRAKQRELRAERPDPAKIGEAIRSHVDDDPTTDEARTGLVWLTTNLRKPEHRVGALNDLIENHTDSQDLVEVCISLSRTEMAEIIEPMKSLMENSENEAVQGASCLAAAQTMHALNARGGEYDTNEIEEMLAMVVSDYAELDEVGPQLAAIAKPLLFELRHLGIGKNAPEIQAPDTDGVEFKLSDYRGKVVLLDFWGHW